MTTTLTIEKCQIQQTIEYLSEFAETKMCHRCIPCPIATRHALEILSRISNGKGTHDDLVNLEHIAKGMKASVMCKKGRDAASYLEMVLVEHKTDFEEHVLGTCKHKTCPPLVKFIILPEKCVSCGRCKEVCQDDAIVGEAPLPYMALAEPFFIRNNKCTLCGKCLQVCEFEAIVVK